MNSIAKASLLYDFYGNLLTEKQKEVMELYHEENLSLAEIAEEKGISRQGVYDSLKKAEKSLEEYEKALGLIERFQENKESIEMVLRTLKSLEVKNRDGLDKAIDTLENMDW